MSNPCRTRRQYRKIHDLGQLRTTISDQPARPRAQRQMRMVQRALTSTMLARSSTYMNLYAMRAGETCSTGDRQ
jgi:hypothetical protein